MKHARIMQFGSAGTTLIELVIALAVSAIVATFSVTLMSAPPAALDNANRRLSLRDSGLQSLEIFNRDLKTALPNSLRFRNNSGVLAIELLSVLDSTTLFSDQPAVPAAQRLTLGTPDATFETLGSLQSLTKPFVSTTAYIALHHSGLAGADAYALANVITPMGTRIVITAGSAPGQDRITLAPAALFTSVGASRRVYVLSGPVSYLCDARTGQLSRYSGYAIAANQTQRDSDAELMAAGAARAVVSQGVGGCRLTATPSASAGQRAYSFTVTLGVGSELIRLTNTSVYNIAG